MFVSSHSSPRGRLLATLLAVTVSASALPSPARAAPILALLADEKVSPEEAASARKSVQERASSLRKSDPEAAAELLSEEAGTRSDPVLYIDAADAYREAGVKEKSRPALETGIEKARIGIDILYFLEDPRADPEWQILDSGKIAGEIRRGEKIIADSEQAITAMETKTETAPAPVDEPKSRKKAPRDGRGLIAGGSLLTVVGVAGLGMLGAGLASGAKAQKDVNNLNPSDLDYQSKVDDLDAKGKLGNTLAIAGGVVAGVGLAAGIALLVVGVKKRKKYREEHGSDDTTAGLRVLPIAGRGQAGLMLLGRF
jgi:hypothetical protein